jgi:peptidoglycan-N-acetylglucosamine deacetylase
MRPAAKRTLGAAAAGAGAFAWYQGQVPTAQLYGRTICRVPGAGKAIALTYDDGPNPRETPGLLKVLERHGATATFLLIGRWAEREPGLTRELVAAGHAIGNHTPTGTRRCRFTPPASSARTCAAAATRWRPPASSCRASTGAR